MGFNPFFFLNGVVGMLGCWIAGIVDPGMLGDFFHGIRRGFDDWNLWNYERNYYLVGGLEHQFYFPINIGNNHPN